MKLNVRVLTVSVMCGSERVCAGLSGSVRG